MESLISAPTKLNPLHSLCSSMECKSLEVISLAPRATRRVPITSTGIMKTHKSLNSAAASVQSLEASEEGRFNNTLPTKEVLEVWRKANAVCFDVDSTVCLDEGIDEVAEFCGAGEAVAEWIARSTGVLFIIIILYDLM